MSNRVKDLRRSKRLKGKIELTNLTFDSDTEHPLLNDLVVENLFSYWKGKSSELADYRVVCKAWNKEIVKLQRKETRIDLAKIVAPYPAGMGWKKSRKKLKTPFYYKIPYPKVRPFENIVLTVNQCANLKNVKWVSWFQLMGSHVKGLQFCAPLSCSCQNQFLERILKKWCPNLECLDLRNVKNYDSLLVTSLFLQNSKDLRCNGLKNLQISVDANEESSFCKDGESASDFEKHVETFLTRAEITFSVNDICNFIYEYGSNTSNPKPFPEFQSWEEVKHIVSGFPPFENEGLPDLSTYFLNILKPTDGGIVGLIMKQINLEKLVFHKFDENFHCESLATFLHIRPSKFRTSLKHLELDNTLSESLKALIVIGKVKFPLTVIKLGAIHYRWDNARMTRFLSYFKETLEQLEISGPSFEEEYMRSDLILPTLPKLKIFVHENISACRLTAANIWESAPNLKTSHLSRHGDGWDANIFFQNAVSVSSIAMRELKLAAPISGIQAELILSLFPNLVKMELLLEMLGAEANKFFENLGKSKVQHLKFEFLGHTIKNKNDTLPWKACDIERLKSLEINNMSGSKFPLRAKSFAEGQLTSLKFINFQIPTNEEKQIRTRLSHIPAVSMVDTL